MQQPNGLTIFSGLQPSGVIHLGNYLGAIKQWIALQDNNTAYYCIVDLHAITVPYEPAELPARILDAAALYLAAGLDPAISTIFVQSHVPAHTELAWLLSPSTPLGELSRMTQFKEKEAKHHASATLGLLAYPILQAADILLYQTDLIPVGEDQVQHIELARNIAKRFNNKFGRVFTVPEAFVNKTTARIMSLTDTSKKMSKSDNPKSYLALTDDADTIRQKINSAVTGTKPVLSFEKSGPAIQNLLRIYQAFSQEEPAAIEQKFTGQGYQSFKAALAELLATKLAPIRQRFRELRADENGLRNILAAGQDKAQAAANQTLTVAKEKMGLA
ncbi:MAG: tryptophan--tRNA ligase [Candidatus Andersenbacteria bacterium]|nr:tryptophan--tRNA ligase [Candidatus Andersenbacteria bacterium]